MVHDDPALLIIADLPPDFRPADLMPKNDSESPFFNVAKFQGLETAEVILDGMAFTLTPYTNTEAQTLINLASLEHVFADAPPAGYRSIGIALGDNISNAKHVSAVNRALLKLAKILGQRLDTHSIVWRPASLNVGFDFFVESADQYIEGGPFPVLLQVAITKSEEETYNTNGLRYFCDQEIRLTAPPDYASNAIIKRLVRVAHDLATNGKIANVIETEGFMKDEKIVFTPNADDSILEVTIGSATMNQLH